MTETTSTVVADARNARKVREGIVVSNKMNKTIVVSVEDRVKHPLYGKVIRRSTKIKAHDENNAASIGDLVVIVATRPISKDKRYALKSVVRKATGI